MKALLWLTVGIALVAAAVGAYIRSYDEKIQWHLMAYWISSLTFLLLFLVSQVVRRAFAEKKAGAIRFAMPCKQKKPSSWSGGNATSLLYPPMPIFVLWVTCSHSIDKAIAGEPIQDIVIMGIVPGMFVGISFTEWWWQRRVWLCREGLVWEVHFVPWKSIDYWFRVNRLDERIKLEYRLGLFKWTLEISETRSRGDELAEFLTEAIGPPGPQDHQSQS